METTNNILDKMTKEKNVLLNKYLLGSGHTAGSFGALIFSGALSAFGIYPILKSSMGEDSLTAGLIVFFIVLVIVDTMKRKYLVQAYNAQTKIDILHEFTQSEKIGKNIWKWKTIFYFTFMFTLVFDGLGVLSTANFIEGRYGTTQVQGTLEYKALQAQIASSSVVDKNYELDLSTWKQEKEDARKACNAKHAGWKAKYSANCLTDWESHHPMPKREHVKRSMTQSDVSNIKKSATSFLTKYVWYITLVLGGALALFLQFTTLSSLQDDNEEVRDRLGNAEIAIIKAGLLQIDEKYLAMAAATKTSQTD